MNTETTLENLSARLNHALEHCKMKKADLARAIGVKPQVIQFLCNSQTQSSRFTFEIAIALGLNAQWLATGEGTMLVIDDPKQQFLTTYKKVPLLDSSNLERFFLEQKPINTDEVRTWLPLNTEDNGTIAIKMLDMSMAPALPMQSVVFIKKISEEHFKNYKFVLCFSHKFNSFLVRELGFKDGKTFLIPQNKEFFKEIELNDDLKILGVVTDCFWHLKE
ncbi:MAG: helix-turn-helix transcriptional regulator [Proteobacteria bacterium]|nr:helix-turn-helix transcriptional regulator [Pseudomonadota bacterium]